jgi:CRP-like cAMP-binding protein
MLRVIGYGDSAIQYEVRYYVEDYADWRRVESEIYRLLWYQFRRAGLEIPFPIRTLHIQRGAARGVDQAQARLLRALRAIDVFRPLSEDELRLAAAAFRHVHYSRGERVLDEGDAGDSFFVIDEGEVDISKRLGGTNRNLARLRAGQFFGEMALLTGESRTATVTAASDVDLFTIDKAGFESIMVTNPAVAEDISMILAARRDALSQAAGEASATDASTGSTQVTQARILAAIRNYFGLYPRRPTA